AKPHAIGIAEVEFRQVAVQMLLATMLVNADHAALEDRVEAFDGIGVNSALALIPNIFLIAVTNGAVTGKLLPYAVVNVGLIGHEVGFTGDVLAHNRDDARNARILDMEAAGGAATLDKGKNGVLVAEPGFCLWLACLTANVGLIS